MHPAPSIIAFTTLSGFGYGLAALLGLGLLGPEYIATKVAHVFALILISMGLLSSTLHLGNPQRAWRAFSQWRTSWLSREGVAAVITFVPLCISAWLCLFEDRYSQPIGLAGAAGAVLTVVCTGMIYASIRAVDAWHSWLTPACYLLFALAGGAMLAGFFAIPRYDELDVSLALPSIPLVLLAWAAKQAWWSRLRTLQPTSSPESATRLGDIGRVTLFERPHVNDNYLTREMGYRVAQKHAAKLSRLALIYGGAVPAVLLFLVWLGGSGAPILLFQLIALLMFALGVIVERWLFFAEARHAVMNYY
jgi:DMSO reductase anchor subunit